LNKDKILAEIIKNHFKEHEVIRDYTVLKIGGVADYFFEAKTVEDLIKSVKAAKKAELPYFLLGSGSNIIFSDYGFPGLVIKNSTSSISFLNDQSQVIADSGVQLTKLILAATSNNLSGLEFLFGVPGTIGGSLYNNAGAYSLSLGDYIKQATVLLPGKKDEDPKIMQLDHDWFDFGYRTSKLKKITGMQKPIVLTIKFQLAQNRQEEIMRRLSSYKLKRENSQPAENLSSSIFRNPIPEGLENVSGKGSVGMPEISKERTAGYLLDKSGAKRLKVGGAKVSSKHANFIINASNAKAHEVRKLIEDMRAIVQKKYNVSLEEEIEYIGQW